MGFDSERGLKKFARTDKGLWLRCEWCLVRGCVALAYQQRSSLTAQGVAVLDQNGDLLDLRPHSPLTEAAEEFVELMPVLKIDTPEFLEFAGDALGDCIESIQRLWLEMARIGFGETLEELCEVFSVPWEGRFLSDLCIYDIRKGHGAFAGLDGMHFRLTESDDDSIVRGCIYVNGELRSFPYEAPASKFLFNSFLRSCVPHSGGDQLLQLRMRQT